MVEIVQGFRFAQKRRNDAWWNMAILTLGTHAGGIAKMYAGLIFLPHRTHRMARQTKLGATGVMHALPRSPNGKGHGNGSTKCPP
ncbi:hypothetical protein D3C81_1526550 [compost metagenome]